MRIADELVELKKIIRKVEERYKPLLDELKATLQVARESRDAELLILLDEEKELKGQLLDLYNRVERHNEVELARASRVKETPNLYDPPHHPKITIRYYDHLEVKDPYLVPRELCVPDPKAIKLLYKEHGSVPEGVEVVHKGEVACRI